MSNYTMTIYEIMEDKVLYPDGILPSDYPFYTTNAKIKKEFEELFLNHYMTSEIGFETVYRWQQAFKAKMMLIIPMMKQRYELYEDWEKNLDYLYDTNDYTDTRIIDTTGSGTSKVTNSDNSSVNSTSRGSSDSNTEVKGSDTNNGVALINASEGNMTTNSITSNESTNEGTSTTTSNSSGTSDSTSSNTGRSEEVFQHKEKRTSLMYPSADLVVKRRELLFDLNREIIEQTRDLFMCIY